MKTQSLTGQYLERAGRIRSAASRAGLTVGFVADKMGWGLRKTRNVFSTAAGAYGLQDRDICRLAFVLCVDPRWLAIGTPSPAGAAAVDYLKSLRKKSLTVFEKLSPKEFAEACATLLLTPQPETGFPECRYCHCTEGAACPEGCAWADADYTICTACLAMPEDES